MTTERSRNGATIWSSVDFSDDDVTIFSRQMLTAVCTLFRSRVRVKVRTRFKARFSLANMFVFETKWAGAVFLVLITRSANSEQLEPEKHSEHKGICK